MTSPLALAGAPGIAVERCNPFGHATDKGPKHLMGGMYGPQYEGKIKWVCKAPATGRYRMECRCDALRHVPAPVMPLCLHHLAMIRKRMSDACTTCMLPQRNIELANEYLAVQDLLRTAQLDGAPEARLLALVSRLNRIGEQIHEMTCQACLVPGALPHDHPRDRPMAHKCKLTLVEVS